MSVSTRRPDAKPLLPPEDAGVSQWLDALAAGACTQEQFLSQVQSLEGDDAELPWEVLSLLDQYLRREIISQDIYVSLKKRLQQRYMGFGAGSSASSPSLAPSNVHVMPPPVPKAVPVAAVATAAAASAENTGAPRVGDTLRGRYRLIDIVDKDLSRTLYEAIDQFKIHVADVSHRVAIEVFDASQRIDPGLMERVCRLQLLTHSSIERIFEVDEERGALFLIRESLHGVSLEQLVEQDRASLSLATSQAIIRNVASALAYAHSHDLFHGDVRAEHVFITDSGEVRLRGFEISARDVPANPKGDRLAFAWLAYELLSGPRAKAGDDLDTTRNSRLHQPHGVTREQWRVLRGTILGREVSPGNVFTVFAGGNDPIGPVLLQQSARARSGWGVGEWMATGFAAAILVAAGYFVVTRGVLNLARASAQPVVALVPAAQTAKPKPVDIPAPKAAVTTSEPALPVAAAPVVATVVATPHLRATIDLPSDTATVSGIDPVARIWVRRRGGLNGEVSFLWWTERGSARIDQDFREITPRMATIANGASGVELLVPLVPDESRLQPRTFYVKIDEPGSGATLGERTLTQVSIIPPGYAEATADR